MKIRSPIISNDIGRNAMRVFDFANYNNTMQTTNTINVAQCIEHKVLIVFHIFGINLDLKIIVACSIVTFCYLVNALHRIHKLLYQVMSMLF